ncbi:MAG: AEC family transporter [Chitinophagaceae bacterium]|nr:MAG: AEC family transporter [Chitinophagaceae bacterium]
MDSILLLFLCLAAGVGLKRVAAFPPNTHVILNQFVIWISLPALALFYIPKIKIDSSLLYPLGIAWIGFSLSFVFFTFIGNWLGFSRKLTGCLILMGGLGNTSFVGFPIIQALYGPEALKTAIIVDQPGSFMVMATLGLIVASTHSRGKGEVSILSRVLRFPPLQAFAVAIVLNIAGRDFPEIAQGALQKLGATVTPLALVATGYQLRIEKRSKHWGMLSLTLLFKLILTPLFFIMLYVWLFGASGFVVEVSIVESAMAPMITAGVLCHQFGLKPRLASAILGIGIPLSLVTIAIWYWLIHPL